MAQQIVRGFPVTLDAFFYDNEGNPVNPTDPQASIVDANGTTVVSLDTPTNVSVGHYQYVYPVAADALLGAWAIRWFGTIDGFPLTDEDGFTVVLPGSISVGGSGDGQTCQPWATHEDAIGPCADYTVDPDEVDVAMQIATDILWNLTGRRYSGICSDAIRPNAQWRSNEGRPRWWPSTGSLAPWGWCSCHRGRDTGCSSVPEIRLPNAPVDPDSIVVKIDGEVFADWRLDDGRFLVRTDGEGWPCCQDMLVADTEPDTFSITYSYGRMAPIGGRRAVALYGCQLLLAMDPGTQGDCILPDNVVQVVRQGVTTRFADPMALVQGGMTGLPFADAWVSSILLGDKRRRATAMIPGLTRVGRRTG